MLLFVQTEGVVLACKTSPFLFQTIFICVLSVLQENTSPGIVVALKAMDSFFIFGQVHLHIIFKSYVM